MKSFRYRWGGKAGDTVTVAELKAKLSEYPDDMPVFCTWEGVDGYVEGKNFEVKKVHKGDTSEECDCLVIDVEKY